MNIGSLYTVKKYFWLLFPSKETVVGHRAIVSTYAPVVDFEYVEGAAAYWSERFNCEVIYFSSDSYIVFLEEDERYQKVLTSDGRIGWTWFSEEFNDCFEEVKKEP